MKEKIRIAKDFKKYASWPIAEEVFFNYEIPIVPIKFTHVIWIILI